MKLTKLFNEFFDSERAAGVVLIFGTLISIAIANLIPAYVDIWHFEIAHHHLSHWINDGLMVIFFLLIGLELEREVYVGELSNLRNASLPIVAALGGMVVPALTYYFININTQYVRGFGIPMATDIAFALGVMSILGNRIPAALKVFLTALAVIDDLGAIIVIAIFYSTGISWLHLGSALGIFAFLLVLNRLKVHVLWPYLVSGIAMWYFMLHSGVHATITGVLLAFAIPFGNGDENSPSYKLQHVLHRPVAFFILPVFAVANTAIVLNPAMFAALTSTVSIGIIAGLLIGKPAGILSFSIIATKLGWSNLPDEINLKHLLGAGILAGIGFTMSIFVTLLAFSDADLIDQTKMAVIAGSVVAGVTGLLWLKYVTR